MIGTVQETPAVLHKIMMPTNLSGTVNWILDVEATITEPVAKIKTEDGSVREVAMLRTWPVRRGRPYQNKLAPDEPMVLIP